MRRQPAIGEKIRPALLQLRKIRSIHGFQRINCGQLLDKHAAQFQPRRLTAPPPQYLTKLGKIPIQQAEINEPLTGIIEKFDNSLAWLGGYQERDIVSSIRAIDQSVVEAGQYGGLCVSACNPAS
jgi:hypothetical protein